MHITVRLVLMVLAIICFALATVGIPSRVNLEALGLMFWALSCVITGT